MFLGSSQVIRTRIYFHIGYHRTGTTFLQRALTESRDGLASAGCLYPAAGFDGLTHSSLALCLPSGRERLVARTRSPGAEPLPEYPSQGPDELYRALATEVRKSGARVAVVSSECFLEHLSLTSLREQLDTHGIDAHFVVFVRRQDRWIESVYSQVVNDPCLAFAGALKGLPQLEMLDFAGEMNRWIDCFGLSRLHLHAYQEGMESSAVASELGRTVGLPGDWWITDGEGPRRKTNTSPDECCFQVPRRLNGWGLATPEVRQVLQVASRDFRRRGVFANWRLPVAQSEAIRHHHHRRTLDLLRRFGVDPGPDWGELPPGARTSAGTKALKYAMLLPRLAPLLPKACVARLRGEDVA
jgi:hypothetical protein